MFTDANDVPTVKDLIQNGNPTPRCHRPDSIWIQPGTKSSIYDAVIVPSTTLLPVVQDVSSSTHARAMVMGFGPFDDHRLVNKQAKYIEGHFVSGYEIPIATPGGPSDGSYVPPTLVQEHDSPSFPGRPTRPAFFNPRRRMQYFAPSPIRPMLGDPAEVSFAPGKPVPGSHQVVASRL